MWLCQEIKVRKLHASIKRWESKLEIFEVNFYIISLSIQFLTLFFSSLDYLHYPCLWEVPRGKGLANEKIWDMAFYLLQAFLENEDLGNSVGSVEALLQKHDDFEEAFTAQEEKIIVSNGSGWTCVSYLHTLFPYLPLNQVPIVTTIPNIRTIPCKLPPLLCCW